MLWKIHLEKKTKWRLNRNQLLHNWPKQNYRDVYPCLYLTIDRTLLILLLVVPEMSNVSIYIYSYIFYNKLINVCTTNLNIKNSYFPFQRKFTKNAKFRINEWQCVPILQLILRLGISKYRNQCTIIKSNDHNSWHNYCTKNRSTCTNRKQFQRDRSYNTDWSSTRNSQHPTEQDALEVS